MRALLRTPRLRSKLLFTVLAVLLYRIGQNVPSLGADVPELRDAAGTAVRDDPMYGLLDLLTGGGLLHLAVLGLGVVPHAAASATLRLVTPAVPRLRALAAETGGLAALRRYTVFLAVALGAAMGTAVAVAAAQRDVLTGPGPVAVAASMTAGTAITAWLIRLISARGFDNGLALLFFTQVCAVFPGLLWDVRETEGTTTFAVALAVVLLTALFSVAVLIVLTQPERRVPVQYARRMVGVRASKAETVFISVPLHRTGLRSVLTALVLLHLPALAARLWPGDRVTGGGGAPDGVWTAPRYDDLRFMLALFALAALVNAGSSRGALDVTGTTNRLAREGAFVPGIRPGRPTAEYLSYVQSRVTAGTPVVLGTIAVLPSAVLALAGVGSPVLGVCLLVVLGAGLGPVTRTVKQAVFEQKLHEFAPYLPTGSAR
ncbi:protein translocase subunit SecY [Actinomadura cremea]|nr:protein translocase subunit SecY [Actinomadura cremea]